jgi:hypothetical protein
VESREEDGEIRSAEESVTKNESTVKAEVNETVELKADGEEEAIEIGENIDTIV